jgi:hypothetical protein
VPFSQRVMLLKVNLAHHPPTIRPPSAHQDPPGYVLRRGRAAFCLAKPWPSSSNRSAEAFGYSIRGWSMGLMRMRSAIECCRRRKAAEGLVAMERWWRLPGARAGVGFGRPVRSVPLLGCLRLLAELLLAAMDVCKRWTVVALGEGTAVLECLR